MDSKHCAVCAQPIAFMDVYIVRAQGRICSRCILARGIPLTGQVSRQELRRKAWADGWAGEWSLLPPMLARS